MTVVNNYNASVGLLTEQFTKDSKLGVSRERAQPLPWKLRSTLVAIKHSFNMVSSEPFESRKGLNYIRTTTLHLTHSYLDSQKVRSSTKLLHITIPQLHFAVNSIMKIRLNILLLLGPRWTRNVEMVAWSVHELELFVCMFVFHFGVCNFAESS